MSNQMFCFQCEQTAGCNACTGARGVCGKSSEVSALLDQLTGKLVGLARAYYADEAYADTHGVMIRGLFAAVTNVNFDPVAIQKLCDEVSNAKLLLTPDCAICGACTRTQDYNLEELHHAPEDIRSLKSLILYGLRGMAAYAFHAMLLGYEDEDIYKFFYKGLFAIGEDWGIEELLPIALELGEVNYKCMELLHRANTETYGIPEPTSVSMTVETGPFIVVTGHDLLDLKLLLEQTKGTGISIYTNGEMLPAHAYPKLKAYSHLKGNFGTAWHRQQTEFAGIKGAVLYTTNCLMPPKESYQDRIFSTNTVGYPEIVHIGEDKDFTPVIQKALELGGYQEIQPFTGINGGTSVTTGFGHETILSLAEPIVNAVKNGDIRHFFLVGGCDGMKKERSYYTDFVKQAPSDSIILTLACGKYRFNDLDLGTINGIPRLLDMGQCNDAYGAIEVALTLSKVFECDVNQLPLTLILSWYEQKAVCILLTLLHLGIKNIYLGPTLPAFLSENIRNYLVETYDLHPITTPENDLEEILGSN